ncbi:MAG: hypothetical protein M0Q47_10165 [Methanothrix sp.]|uniref:hypothetical protein n=1 Tax=Methanothrix sp. TaxID=90426 RepID=UPI0025EED0FE|nr:hypothetical protein [Methanothrix sp.]MCK9406756.1 hypothetical protein [Methanothrix sp.]
MANELQLSIFNKIKEEICSTLRYNAVGKNAIEVKTPFLDWKGAYISFFITEDGRITDGGQILSQLKSLRVIEDFNNWEFRLDFLHRSCIQQVRGSLQATNDEEKALLKFIQGISRLPNYFEPKPIYSVNDKFPIKVRREAIKALIPFVPQDYEKDPLIWASEFVKERRIHLNGLEVQSDMSPKKYYRMVQIISHATSSSSDRKQHVSAKVLDSVLWKRKISSVEMFAVVEDLNPYPPESRHLLKEESVEIIQMKKTNSSTRLAEILIGD